MLLSIADLDLILGGMALKLGKSKWWEFGVGTGGGRGRLRCGLARNEYGQSKPFNFYFLNLPPS